MLKDRMIKILSKNLTLIHIAVLLYIASASSVFGAPGETVVYPTGIFPQDVQNVQAAVNAGGRVRLKAVDVNGHPTAFNFGTPENLSGRRVFLLTNVSISGERIGRNVTTIRGGNIPFRGKVPVTTSISGISFEGPRQAAIQLTSSTGTSITNNHVSGVVGTMTGFGYTFGDGIDVFGYQNPASAITGRVTVSFNRIENLHADFANGIQLDGVAAQSEIIGNTIRDVESVGILVIRSGSTTAIEENLIIPGPGNGTALLTAGAGIYIAEGKYSVKENSIRCENVLADGILAIGGGFAAATSRPVIDSNRIEMNGSQFGGISLYGLVDHSQVSENSIRGNGAFAVLVAEGPDPNDRATDNRFRENNISRFTSSVGDVLFSSNTANNSYKGRCRSIIDLGVNNDVRCGEGEKGMFDLSVNQRRGFEKFRSPIGNSAITIPLDDDKE